jgi:hypothetical protein
MTARQLAKNARMNSVDIAELVRVRIAIGLLKKETSV